RRPPAQSCLLPRGRLPARKRQPHCRLRAQKTKRPHRRPWTLACPAPSRKPRALIRRPRTPRGATRLALDRRLAAPERFGIEELYQPSLRVKLGLSSRVSICSRLLFTLGFVSRNDLATMRQPRP